MRLLLVIIAIVSFGAHQTCARADPLLVDGPARTFKILHVMGYHSPCRWSDGQFQGFREALRDVPVEFRVFQLDAMRQSSPLAKEKAGREARELIDRWKPDLVYATADEAQELVTRHYVGTELPFVFSGVSGDPAGYGLSGSKNVTGVLESERFVESVQLLKRLVPGVRKIAVILDESKRWIPVQRRMRQAAATMPDVEVGPWDVIRTFEEYKQRMEFYQGRVDALALVGIHGLKDAKGKDVPSRDVMKWTVEHSRLPDLTFWMDRVHKGTLCAVTTSEREQGIVAGRMARAILTEGKSPSSFSMSPAGHGLPAVSLARARMLGIVPRTGVLLSAEIVQAMDWREP